MPTQARQHPPQPSPGSSSPHVALTPQERHAAAIVLRAALALATVQEQTLRGLREVQTMMAPVAPRAASASQAREAARLKDLRRAASIADRLAPAEPRRDFPRVGARPSVSATQGHSDARAVAAHLIAIRSWHIRQQRRWATPSRPAALRLAEALRRVELDAEAALIEGLWSEARE